MGICAAIFALLLLAAAVYLVFYQYGFWLFPLVWQNILMVSATVVIAGILITFFSSIFAVNRYIRMKTDDLYYV